MNPVIRYCLLGLLFCPAGVYAQFRFGQPVRVGLLQGLPTEDIRAIGKSSKGFLWIATSRGLASFDGSQVATFSLTDQQGRGSNDIYSLAVAHGRIWAGTTKGLVSMDEANGSLRYHALKKDLVPEVLVLRADSRGLWIGTRQKGFWYLDESTDSVTHFDWDEEAIPPVKPLLGGERRVLSFEFSRTNDSIIWVGTSAGLIRFNRYNREMRWHLFERRDPSEQVAVNSFRRLLHHPNGKLYTGSWNAGVHEFNPETGSLTPLRVEGEKADRILRGAIRSILPNTGNRIWISCGSGLLLYDVDLNRVVEAWENDQVNEEFYGTDLVEEQGRIWHFNINGLLYFDPLRSQFNAFSYAHLFGRNWAFSFNILEGDRNTIMVSPRNGNVVYFLDRETSTWRIGPVLPGSHKRPVIWSMVKRKNNLLLSTDQGLFEAAGIGKMKPVHLPYNSRFNRYNEMIQDRQGRLWIVLDDEGLLFWDPQKADHRLIAAPGLIRRLYCDTDNSIWFSSDSGVCRVDPQGSTLVRRTGFVKVITEDQRGRIWMAFNGDKIGYLTKDASDDKLIRVSLKGLGSDAEIGALAVDPSGLLWGYTDEFLFSWDHERQELKKFPIQYGTQRADFYHMSFLSSGELVLGGRSKVFIIDTRDLRKNDEIPEPYLRRVELFNQGGRKQVPALHEPLVLKHTDNSLSIHFSALAFAFGDQVKFRYRLKGSEDWKETDRRSVNYSSLRGGDYTFQLMASNNEGEWSDKMVELSFRIRIPWWRSAWFYAILATGFCLGLYAWYRSRLDSIRRKEMLKTEYEKKLANVEMSALLAQMNPHFLFNSLNSIDSYIIRNESGKASEYLNNFARLIRRILHNSRTGMVSLKDEIETLDLYLQMESLRFRDRFEFSIDVEEGLANDGIHIPPMLIQPYVENAIWHGIMHRDNRSKGRVLISICKKGGALHCIVRDNGIGRKKAMELAAQSQGPKKSSMGMQITQERIDMINKLYNRSTSVTVTDLVDADQRPAGTEVHLVIPLT